jgi:hypothetical protein
MKIDNKDIFEQIGNLFYAIAADQNVKPIEVAELKSLISKDWLPRNLNERVVSDATHCILVTMDSLKGNKATAKEAYDEFLKFYRAHSEVFSSEVKERMLDTALEIIKVFRADNPLNNPHVDALRNLLNLDRAKV